MADVLTPASFEEVRSLANGEVVTYDFEVNFGDLDQLEAGNPHISATWQFTGTPVSTLDVQLVRPDGTVAATQTDGLRTAARPAVVDLREPSVGASARIDVASRVGKLGGLGGVGGGIDGPLDFDDIGDVIDGGETLPPEPPPALPPHITYDLTEADSPGTWQLRVANPGANTSVRISCQHPFAQRRLSVSRVPLSLIRRWLSTANRVAGVDVRIGDGFIRVTLGAEFRHLLGIENPAPVSRDRVVGETDSVELSLQSDGGTPVVQLELDFKPGAHVDLPRPLSNKPFDKISLRAGLRFRSLEHRNHTVGPIEKVEFTKPGVGFVFDVIAEPNVVFEVPHLFELDLAAEVRAAVLRARGQRPDIVREIGLAFADTLTFLATGRRHRCLFDATVSGSDLVIRHYPSALARSIVSHPIEDIPLEDLPVLEDTAAGAGIDAGIAGARPLEGARTGGRLRNLTEGIEISGELVGRKIDHVVVLMMENRSFDHMLGYLSLPSSGGGRDRSDIDGLRSRAAHSNPVPNSNERVSVFPLNTPFVQRDPDHGFDGTLAQINDGDMSGFVESYRRRLPAGSDDFGLVMGYYDHDFVNVMDMLAREYGVCDRWFSSHPGPTYPNRFISLCGRTPDVSNIDIGGDEAGAVRMPTVFDALSDAGVSWNYVEGNIAFLRMFDRYRIDETNIIQHPTFFEKARQGNLPAVTWIDPNFGELEIDDRANDDHPPANIRRGQELIADVYNALIANPDQWASTLFVVTYDEHGGFYDHVAPAGLDPDDPTIPRIHPDGVDHLGPRVPTLVMSPWIGRGHVTSTVYDHTSLIKTILDNFVGSDAAANAGLGDRVASSNSLLDELSDVPRTDRPAAPGVGTVEPVPPDAFDDLDPKSFHLGMRLFPFGFETRATILDRATSRL